MTDLQTKPAASFWQTSKMVAWAFLGIRRKSASVQDVARAGPFHIMLVGIVGALLLVLGLMLLVKWIVA